MTTPRQYTDATDPNAVPADQVSQPTEDFAPASQQVDPTAQQSSPPPATTEPAFRETDGAHRTDAAPQASSESNDALFAGNDLSELRARWNDVQAAFVDDPRDCVQKADHLVSSAVEQLTANFSQTRSRLEEQWQRGEEASTEDLRVALKHYRDFFDRLLAV